jgi:hypothetical protein
MHPGRDIRTPYSWTRQDTIFLIYMLSFSSEKLKYSFELGTKRQRKLLQNRLFTFCMPTYSGHFKFIFVLDYQGLFPPRHYYASSRVAAPILNVVPCLPLWKFATKFKTIISFIWRHDTWAQTYQLISMNRTLLHKLIYSQLVDNFFAFFATRKLITVFATSCLCSLSWIMESKFVLKDEFWQHTSTYS